MGYEGDHRRSTSSPIGNNFPDICWECLKNTTGGLNLNSRFSSSYFNPGPPEHEGPLPHTLQSQRYVGKDWGGGGALPRHLGLFLLALMILEITKI
jgi:hypothetical protein